MIRLPIRSRRAFLADSLAGAAALTTPFARPALADSRGIVAHGIAMHGEPALPATFTALPYANPDAPQRGRLVIGAQGTFDSLNPFNLKAGSTAHGLNTNVFQTLMTRSLDEPFTLYGLIAQTIETDAARSYATFRIDPRAAFSDGTKITAEHVLFTFNLLRTKGRPQQRAAYGIVKAATSPDPLTVHYDLAGANDRELPLTLALMPVLPKHRTDVEGFNETTLEPPLGSGPYVVADVKPGERLTLKRNRDYWGRDLPVHRGLFNFDEVRVDYYRDANSLFEAFKAGLFDYRIETDPTRWTKGYDIPAVREGRIIRETVKFGLPKGMDGFAFNTRRPIFANVLTREALSLMFDFEWINANLYGGVYTRTKSFFDDSDLASTGRPATPREREMLARFPGAVREDVLEGRWAPPKTDGSGRDRAPARRALQLLKQAGWTLADGALVNQKTGEVFAFEIMVTDRRTERLALNFSESLKRIGVRATVRVVDEVQYQRRRQKFDFDMMPGTWVASPSPGNEQRARWGSQGARQEGSFNLTGANSPAIDAMIGEILAAKTREDFVAAVRAFDRLLVSGFYIVPLFHTAEQWVAYWATLAHPERTALFGLAIDTWWRKPA